MSQFQLGFITNIRLAKPIATLALSLLLFPASVGKVYADEPADTARSRVALASLQNAFSAVADEVEPAVVTIFSAKTLRSNRPRSEEGGDENSLPPFLRGPKRSTGVGSGVIIRSEGWVLTNDHVVGGADRVMVRLNDGREFVGTVRRDFRSDLALVKIESKQSFPTAKLGDSEKVKIGHWAIAIGSPFRYEGTFSVGVVSSLRRQHAIQDSTTSRPRLYLNMIQTDAAINPGNSGGPLCNLDGEVIAINTAIDSDSGGSIGIGFSIPINTAKYVVEQLIAKGKVTYGHLGVSPKDVTPRHAKAFGVDKGCWVDEEPRGDTPAGKAGIHAGDVIIAIDNKPIEGELDLRTTVARTAPGTAVVITLFRNKKIEKVKATIEESAAPADQEKEKPVGGDISLGFEVDAVTELAASSAGLATPMGVVIKSTDPKSAAADLEEVRPGTILLKLNETAVNSVAAYKNAVSALKSGDQVKLLFQARGRKFLRVITVE